MIGSDEVHDIMKEQISGESPLVSSISLYWFASVTAALLNGNCHLSFPAILIMRALKQKGEASHLMKRGFI